MSKEEIGGCIITVIVIVIVSEIVKFIQKYFVYILYALAGIVVIFILIKITGKIRDLPPRRRVIKEIVRVNRPYKQNTEIKRYMNKLDKEFEDWNDNNILREKKI